eukprot:GDKI01046047.1.p1 GENE.GDKI01046047.1~~GDKI01046047.1.p1  ORF type:complete len:202 (-),score=32.12 GDKI01046047.1:19-624(-)
MRVSAPRHTGAFLIQVSSGIGMCIEWMYKTSTGFYKRQSKPVQGAILASIGGLAFARATRPEWFKWNLLPPLVSPTKDEIEGKWDIATLTATKKQIEKQKANSSLGGRTTMPEPEVVSGEDYALQCSLWIDGKPIRSSYMTSPVTNPDGSISQLTVSRQVVIKADAPSQIFPKAKTDTNAPGAAAAAPTAVEKAAAAPAQT